MSASKAAYVSNVARWFSANPQTAKKLRSMTDEEVVEASLTDSRHRTMVGERAAACSTSAGSTSRRRRTPSSEGSRDGLRTPVPAIRRVHGATRSSRGALPLRRDDVPLSGGQAEAHEGRHQARTWPCRPGRPAQRDVDRYALSPVNSSSGTHELMRVLELSPRGRFGASQTCRGRCLPNCGIYAGDPCTHPSSGLPAVLRNPCTLRRISPASPAPS